MAVPKRRHSTRRKGKRVAEGSKTLPQLVKCTHCAAYKRSHTVCASCGKK